MPAGWGNSRNQESRPSISESISESMSDIESIEAGAPAGLRGARSCGQSGPRPRQRGRAKLPHTTRLWPKGGGFARPPFNQRIQCSNNQNIAQCKPAAKAPGPCRGTQRRERAGSRPSFGRPAAGVPARPRSAHGGRLSRRAGGLFSGFRSRPRFPSRFPSQFPSRFPGVCHVT